jgi:hypothetical protein
MPIDPSALYARGLISDNAMQRLTPVSGDFPPGKTPPSKFLDYERRPPDLMGGAPRQSVRSNSPKILTSPEANAALGVMSPLGAAGKTVIKAFHGTDENFASFDPSKQGAGYGDAASGYGFHFTENQKLAKHFGKNVLEREITLNNPKTIDVEGGIRDDYNHAKSVGNFDGPFDEFVSNHIENPYGYYEAGSLASDLYDAKAAGHDGLVLDFGTLKDPKFGPLKRAVIPFDTSSIGPADK